MQHYSVDDDRMWPWNLLLASAAIDGIYRTKIEDFAKHHGRDWQLGYQFDGAVYTVRLTPWNDPECGYTGESLLLAKAVSTAIDQVRAGAKPLSPPDPSVKNAEYLAQSVAVALIVGAFIAGIVLGGRLILWWLAS